MASSLVARTIFFIVTLFVGVTIAFTFNQLAGDNVSALGNQNTFLSNKIKTSISIESFAYNITTQQAFVYIRNIGVTTINPSYVDLYLDGIRLDKSTPSTFKVESDTDLVDQNYWDNGEILLITFNRSISYNNYFTVLVTENHGAYDLINQTPNSFT